MWMSKCCGRVKLEKMRLKNACLFLFIKSLKGGVIWSSLFGLTMFEFRPKKCFFFQVGLSRQLCLTIVESKYFVQKSLETSLSSKEHIDAWSSRWTLYSVFKGCYRFDRGLWRHNNRWWFFFIPSTGCLQPNGTKSSCSHNCYLQRHGELVRSAAGCIDREETHPVYRLLCSGWFAMWYSH